MFKTTILSLSLILSCFISLAQKDVKFGEVDKATIESKVYEKDKNAVAVVLYDYTKITAVYFDSRSKKNTFKRIKIFKNEGLEYGTMVIPYYISANEKVIDIKGYTYNLENGKIVKTKLTDKQIFDVKKTKYNGEVKITMPNIKEGSVIDISYNIDSERDMNLGPWYFQTTIPIEWCELELLTPYNWDYTPIYRNERDFYISQNLKETASNGMIISRKRYVLKDVSAFSNDKSFIATPEDYIGHAFFLLATIYQDYREPRKFLTNWSETAYSLGIMADFYSKDAFVKDKITPLTNGKTDDEKISIVFDYVKNNFKCTSKDFSKNTKEIFDKKEVNVFELSYLLINYLRSSGLEAHPILLSTRDNGRVIKDYPLRRQFNYMIVYVKTKEGKEIYLDPTNNLHSVGIIAKRALSYDGILIFPESKYEWVDLRHVPKTSTLKTGLINISADGYLKGKITTQLQGYEALEVRNKLKGIDDSLSIKESSELKEDTIKVEYKNVDDIKKSLEYSKEINSDKGIQSNGDVLYITPLMESAMKENPFKQEKRTLPIDLVYPKDEIFVYTFQIPEGYKIEEVPQPAKFQWADGKSIKFEYITKKNESSIQISCKLMINRVIFQPEEYEALKKFYADIVAKETEQIVLKKIK